MWKKILSILGGCIMTIILLVLLMILTVVGTLAQKEDGILQAQSVYFQSVVFWTPLFSAGKYTISIPFPGGYGIFALLFINLVVSFFTRFGLQWKMVGVWICHLGIAMLLAGSFFSYHLAEHGSISLEEGQKTDYVLSEKREETSLGNKKIMIPFFIKLLHFRKATYPGTEIPKSFESRVAIQDGALYREFTISMNFPLRYKGFTFYQSSYAVIPTMTLVTRNALHLWPYFLHLTFQEQYKSTLAMVRNPASIWPYLSCITILAGMLLHFGCKVFIFFKQAKR